MLLLATAGLGAPERGSEEWRCAVEVVEACGRLPMAVAIAGGLVSNYGSLDENLVEIWSYRTSSSDELVIGAVMGNFSGTKSHEILLLCSTEKPP